MIGSIVSAIIMARRTKAQIQKEKIEQAYWDSILLHGKAPPSVYALCKELGLEETDFYTSYASLNAIESGFWSLTVEQTIEVLQADEDYAEYDFQQKRTCLAPGPGARVF